MTLSSTDVLTALRESTSISHQANLTNRSKIDIGHDKVSQEEMNLDFIFRVGQDK
jgi:hypothetical protein